MSKAGSVAGAGSVEDPLLLTSDSEGSELAISTAHTRDNDAVAGSTKEAREDDATATQNGNADKAREGETADEEEVQQPEKGGDTATRTVQQKCIRTEETFAPHPTDPALIIATFRMQIPNGGGEFVQVVEIPELRPAPAASFRTEPGTFVFYPSLTDSKVPRKKRSSKNKAAERWVRDITRGEWTRGTGDYEETFKPIIIFRAFNPETMAYEEAYVGAKKLENVDPNDKAWAYSYNKWIDQIKRRRDGAYIKSVHRNHWTVAEKRILYKEVNDFCEIYGLWRFGFGPDAEMKMSDLEAFAKQINRVGGNSRNADAVRSQIVSAHPGKNKEIFELLQRAEAARLKRKKNPGVKLPMLEEFPENAIPLSKFPTKESEARAKDSKKGKRRQTEEASPEPSKKRSVDAAFGKQEAGSDSEDSEPFSLPSPPPNKVNKHTATANAMATSKKAGRKRKRPARPDDEKDMASDSEDSALSSLASPPPKKAKKDAANAKAATTPLKPAKKRKRPARPDDSDEEEVTPEPVRDDSSDASIIHHHDDADTPSPKSLSPPPPPKKHVSKKRKRAAAVDNDEGSKQGWKAEDGHLVGDSGSEWEDITPPRKKSRLLKAAYTKAKAVIDNDNDSDLSDF